MVYADTLIPSRMWIRGRSSRPGRTDDEDEFQLDLTKDHVDNTRDILTNLCKRQGVVSERRRLSYLNAFVKLLTKCEHDYTKLGFTAEEILYCMRPALLHDTTQVRSGGLRALRYMLHSRHEAAISTKLQYPLLIARSLDLTGGSDHERVQAVRVVRRLLCLDAAQFPISLARSLIAIASGTEDRLINVTLGTLAELCVLNPELFISVGGVTTILRSLSSVKCARMAEALVGSLLFLQNKPATRQSAALSLDCLAAPYTDLQAAKESQGADRFRWPHVTLLSTLRSWPGVLHFCHPLKDGLRSIVATLYLNQLDVRKAVLDLLYELLCLAQPEWSDEISVALEAVDPSRTQDSFKLVEGFVAAEGKTVLPHLSKCRVNLTELHLALLLYCFLEVGLLDAIVEVIIAEDTFLSVRATILLGELLHLTHLLLPPECCHLTPSLPNLLSYAVRGRPHSSTRYRQGYFSIAEESALLSNHGPYSAVTDLPSKKSIIAMLMGGPTGHSSVRTVSESSTERVPKQEGKKSTNEENFPVSIEKRNPDNKRKSREDQTTTHLLKDVQEVLADMTNTEIKSSPKHRQPRNQSKSSGLSFGHFEPSRVEPPPCSRAQQRALAAVMTLSRLHRVLRQRPAPASIHLDHVLAAASGRPALDGLGLARAKGRTQSRAKLTQALSKECDEAIKDSQVLTIKDCFSWNWDIIRAVLKSRPECLRRCEDSNHRQFLRRLVQFVAPSSRQMSCVSLTADQRTLNRYTLTAMELLDCLLQGQPESECEKLLWELLIGLKTQFEAILSGKSAHDCMFSPQSVKTTLCQDYFLLMGHLSRSRAGCDLLDKTGILHILLVLSTTSKHDCYVKLIISSLDYSTDERTRNVMSSTLVCQEDSSRLYATKFLRILLRTPLNKHADYGQWVVELLANQLSDINKAVSLNAVSALDEACDCKEYLDALINLRPSLLHLGDKGLLLLIRFLSTETGFRYMSEANFVTTQLNKWVKFNLKYVCIVEGELADGLTLVERNEDGRYSTRVSNTKRMPGDVYVPPHLYGQLAQHSEGLDALLADDNVPKLAQVVLQGQCNNDSEILELKAALWALGHLSSCPGGALWARNNSVTRAMVSLACSCLVYSVRATAFHSIALTATNNEGADTLRALGWHTVRHNRSQHWPVVAPLSMLEDVLTQYQEDTTTRDSSESTTTDTVTKNNLFILGEDLEFDEQASLVGFPTQKVSVRERKSATLPPSGSSHTYHHNRSYSESKADSEWARSTTPVPSHSGSDITDFSHEHSRLYSESSTSGTSSCGDSSRPRTYLSDKLMQTLSPIPSTGSLATTKSHRRISVASSQGPSLSPKDIAGYAALQSLHRSRRPTFFASPHLSLPFSQSAPGNVSPLSPIELIAFQDWKQMSPLVRPRHPDIHPIEPQFEVSGVNCPLPYTPHSVRTLHYESSHSCIAQPPEDPVEEDSSRPCYQGICLPQNLVDLFPEEEVVIKAEDPPPDNNSTTGMDVSSCDSETDTAGEGEGENGQGRGLPHRRHLHTSCLLCCVSRLAAHKPGRWRKISASSQHRTRTETESSYGGCGNDGESPVALPWHSRGGLEGITSVDSTGTDITSLTQRSLGDTFKSRSVVRKEIIRLSEQICNPILYKSCKQALLQLKQMYGDVFNDICVYSDMCSVMASVQHKIHVRRFLQELFLDAPFSEIYEDPLGILTAQNGHTEGDDANGPSGDMASEVPIVEDHTSENNIWKTSAPKMNGYDSEQRLIQGSELEVILENDARSESSDMGRGNSESSTVNSRGSVTTPFDLRLIQETVSDVQGEEIQDFQISSTVGDEVGCKEYDLTQETISLQHKRETQENVQQNINKWERQLSGDKQEFPDMITETVNILLSASPLNTKATYDGTPDLKCKEDETQPSQVPSALGTQLDCLITVSRSSQQLKKEFFNSSVTPESGSSLDRKASVSPPTNESKSLRDCDESFATKVADSISKSQSLLEPKQPLVDKVEENIKSSGMTVTAGETGKQPGSSMMTTVKKDSAHESGKKKDSSTRNSGTSKLEKGKNKGSNQNTNLESTSVNNNNKSPLLFKKFNKINNAKPNTNLATKHETPMKSSSGQCPSQIKHLNSSKVSDSLGSKTESKTESGLGKKDINKTQNKTSELCTDASTSKVQGKSTKQKSIESSLTCGKPPSGSGRQRKKAVTKTPNRDSLETLSRDS